MRQLPDSFFVTDGTVPGMVEAGEPRLRHYSRPGGDRVLRPLLARVLQAIRLPEVARVATSR